MNKDKKAEAGMSYSGNHVLNFWVVPFEKGAVSKFIYLYKVDNKLDENELSKFINLDCQSFLEKARQSDYKRVEDKRHEIQQRMINKFNDIQDLKISSLPFPEILKFEGISLWQFVTERCYDSYPREIIELIEYVTELVETFDPGEIRIFGELKDPQRNVLKLISQHYGKTVSFYEVTVNTTGKGSNGAQKKHFVEPAYRRLEGGDRFAIRDYACSIKNNIAGLVDNVLLLSWPRVLMKNCNGVEIDQYYDAFKAFFEEKGWSPVRLEPPHYFQIQGSKKEYIDSCKIGEKGGFPTIFFDEYYEDKIAEIGEKYKNIFEQNFNYFSKTREFRSAFTWKGISFFKPLYDFWRNLFVDYLATQCVTSILVSREIIASSKPKAIFAVGEFGVYARAMIIEAHRAGIPSIGLQHAFIHQDLFYYMQKNVSNRPNLRDGFWGLVVPAKTLVYGDYHKKVLTAIGHYPDDSVSVLGSDWRLLNQKHEDFDEHKAETLRAEWFSSPKKVALILTGAFTTAIVYRLIEKLDPSRYAILVKLHPLDKNEHFYYKSFTENNFEVKVIRHYLHESIELADLIFAPLNTTVVLDCLALNKIVFYHKEFDVGGILPWENLATNMLAIDEYDKVKISKEDTIRIHNFLREIGYDRNITIESFNAKLHQVFKEIEHEDSPGNISQEDLSSIESFEILNRDNNRIAASAKIAEEAKKLVALGNSKGIAPALKKSLEFTPNYIPPHNNAEMAVFQTKKLEQSAGSLKQAYSSDSRLFGASKNLAMVAKEADRIDKAENIFGDSLRQWPSDNEICAELETRSVASSVPCESETASTDIGTGTVTERELLRSQNDLYKQLDVNYDNFFPKIYENESPYFKNRPIMQQIKRISFELSNICNYAYCHKKCPLHGQQEKIVLPSRIVRETIDEVAQINYDGVFAFHIYSEPLIDPRLFSFMIYSKTKCPKSKTLILTNGFYLNQRIADELAELGIWILAVTSYSRSEFKRLSQLDVKVPYYVFEADLVDLKNMYDKTPLDTKILCHAPVGDVSVACTGDVVLCCRDWKRRHRFGNLTQESLYSILNKKETLEVYNSLIRGERKLYLCRRCNWAR